MIKIKNNNDKVIKLPVEIGDWLKNKKCFNRWVNNTIEVLDKTEDPEDINVLNVDLMLALKIGSLPIGFIHIFKWETTPEGYEYWRDIFNDFKYWWDNNKKEIVENHKNI